MDETGAVNIIDYTEALQMIQDNQQQLLDSLNMLSSVTIGVIFFIGVLAGLLFITILFNRFRRY